MLPCYIYGIYANLPKALKISYQDNIRIEGGFFCDIVSYILVLFAAEEVNNLSTSFSRDLFIHAFFVMGLYSTHSYVKDYDKFDLIVFLWILMHFEWGRTAFFLFCEGPWQEKEQLNYSSSYEFLVLVARNLTLFFVASWKFTSLLFLIDTSVKSLIFIANTFVKYFLFLAEAFICLPM